MSATLGSSQSRPQLALIKCLSFWFAPQTKSLTCAALRSMVKAVPLPGHAGTVECLAFAPRGDLLASGSGDRRIKLWQPGTGETIATLAGHAKFVKALTFSPDAARLASGSYDTTIRVWDVQTLDELEVIRGHENTVYGIGFSHDGSRLVSGSFDRTIKIWRKI